MGNLPVSQIAALSDELARYSLYKGIEASTEYSYGRAVSLFGDFLGRPATIEDLTDEAVSRWLQSLVQSHHENTVAHHRSSLLTLWRDIADRGLVAPPHRVRKVKSPEPAPVAWTADEFHRVSQRCGQLTGAFPSGAKRSHYCRALMRVAYDTGLRRSDLWTLQRDQVRIDGTVVMRQKKTGHAHFPRMRQTTFLLFVALPGDVPLACPYASHSAWYKFWREHVIKPAGVPHGCLQKVRRTGATHLAIEHENAVQQYLGHRTQAMQRHYVDKSIARPQQHLPPEITTARA